MDTNREGIGVRTAPLRFPTARLDITYSFGKFLLFGY